MERNAARYPKWSGGWHILTSHENEECFSLFSNVRHDLAFFMSSLAVGFRFFLTFLVLKNGI